MGWPATGRQRLIIGVTRRRFLGRGRFCDDEAVLGLKFGVHLVLFALIDLEEFIHLGDTRELGLGSGLGLGCPPWGHLLDCAPRRRTRGPPCGWSVPCPPPQARVAPRTPVRLPPPPRPRPHGRCWGLPWGCTTPRSQRVPRGWPLQRWTPWSAPGLRHTGARFAPPPWLLRPGLDEGLEGLG